MIVDGPYLAHRSYSAPYKLTTKDGKDATMIHSFMRSLNAVYKKVKPKETIVAWESHGTTSWRREIYPAYKPSKSIDIQYVNQLKDVQILLYLFGVKQYTAPKNEADDVIAKLVKINKHNTIIFTVDKDIMQLVNDNCHVFNDKTKEIFDISKVKEKFGIYPFQIPDLLAIVGDKADNIEGIEGYGYKKSIKILKEYGMIESISNKEPVNKYRTKLIINKRLTRLNDNCQLEKYTFNGTKTIESILDKYELVKMKENINQYKSIRGER